MYLVYLKPYYNSVNRFLRIDIYSEGARDIMDMIMVLPFTPADQKQKQLDKIQGKAKERSLPAYEKVWGLHYQ